jgi:hypothetical protein
MKSITVTQHKLASNDLSNSIRSTGGPVHNDTSGFEGKLGEICELTKIIKNRHPLSIMKTLERRHFINMVACSITSHDNVNQDLLHILWKLDLPIAEHLFDSNMIDDINRLRQSIYDLHTVHTALGKSVSVNFIDILDSIMPQSTIAQRSILQQSVVVLSRFLRQLLGDNRANTHHWPEQWQATGIMYPRMIIQTAGMHNNSVEIYTKYYTRVKQTESYSVQYRDHVNAIQYGNVLAFFESVSDNHKYLHAIINKYPVKGTKVFTEEVLVQAESDVFNIIQPENIISKVAFMKVTDPVQYSFVTLDGKKPISSKAGYKTVINY